MKRSQHKATHLGPNTEVSWHPVERTGARYRSTKIEADL